MRKNTTLTVIGFLSFVTILIILFREISPGELMAAVLSVRRPALVIYIISAILGTIVRSWRYELTTRVLSGEDHVSRSTMLFVTGIRNVTVDLLPARLGELVFVELLRRNHVPFATAATTFGVCLVLDVAVILLLGALLFIFFPAFSLGALSTVALIFSAVLLLVILVFMDRAIGFVHSAAGRVGVQRQIVSFLGEVANELPALRRSGAFIELLLLTTFLRFLKYGSLYVLLVGTLEHWRVPTPMFAPTVGIGAFILAELSASLPASGFLGFGLYEGTWATVFALSGVSLPTSALIGIPLTVHILTQFIGYLLGALSILGLVVVTRSEVKKKG